MIEAGKVVDEDAEVEVDASDDMFKVAVVAVSKRARYFRRSSISVRRAEA